MVDDITKAKIVAEVEAEVRAERIRCKSRELKKLYVERDKAHKIYKNICREIDDFLEELSLDDDES